MINALDVQHIAKLARIQLTDDELAKYQTDLSQILEYFDTLQEVDTKEVEPMTHSVLHENIAREDNAQRQQPEVTERMMQLLPVLHNGFLKVKAILSFK